MAQINIAIVVDAITLATNQPGGSWNSPISLGSYSQSDAYVSMIAQGGYASNDQGQSELTVNAHVGDIIQFTITAPGAGVNYYPILYNAVLSNTNLKSIGADNQTWVNTLLASGGSGTQPTFATTIPAGYPNAGQPNTFYNSVWQFEVNGVGSTQYSMMFAVMNTQTQSLTPVGYYQWDPFVNISN